MDMHSYFGTLAGYNAWATRKLFEHVAALNAESDLAWMLQAESTAG